MRQVQQLAIPTATLELGKYLMNNAQEGFKLNEAKRQNQADNLYRDRRLMQDDTQFNKTFGLNQDKFNEDKRQFGETMNYKNKALTQEQNQFNLGQKYKYDALAQDNNQFKLGQGYKYYMANQDQNQFNDKMKLGYYEADKKNSALTPYQDMMIQFKKSEEESKVNERKRKLVDSWRDKVIPTIDNYDNITPEQQDFMREQYINSDGLYNPQIKSSGGFLGTFKDYAPVGYNNQDATELLKRIEENINKL